MDILVAKNTEVYQRRKRGQRGRVNVQQQPRSEGLPAFLADNSNWLKYFNKVINHTTIELEERGLYIFCAVRSSLEISIVDTKHFVYQDGDGNATKRWCADFNAAWTRPRETGGLPAIKITINGKLQGFLFPTLKTLVLSDLTHWEMEHGSSPTQRQIIEDQYSILTDILNWAKDSGYITLKEEEKKEEEKKVKWDVIPHDPDRVKIGTDPEQECLVNGKVVSAQEFLRPRITSASMGAEVGWDGCSSTMEIRPKADKDPEKVVANIQKCYQRIFNYGAQVGLSGNKAAIGGHIHIGAPVDYNLDDFLIFVFDELVGIPTYHLNSRRRIESGYAGLHLSRQQPHGIEYRTPPGQVFYHPRLVELVFKMMKNATLLYMSGEDVPLYVSCKREPGSGRAITKYSRDINIFNLKNWGRLEDGEVADYYNLIDSFTPDVNKFIAAWNISTTAPVACAESVMEFDFADEWSEDVSEQYRTMLNTALKTVSEHVKTTDKKPWENKRILLYGLNENRGDTVAGFKVSGYKTIDHPKYGCNSEVIVPHIMRMLKASKKAGQQSVSIADMVSIIHRKEQEEAAKHSRLSEKLNHLQQQTPISREEIQVIDGKLREIVERHSAYHNACRALMRFDQASRGLASTPGQSVTISTSAGKPELNTLFSMVVAANLRAEGFYLAYGVPKKCRFSSTDMEKIVEGIVTNIISGGTVSCA